MQWSGVTSKEGFLNQHLVKTAALFSFFFISNIMVKTFIESVKIKNIVLDVQSVTHLEAF